MKTMNSNLLILFLFVSSVAFSQVNNTTGQRNTNAQNNNNMQTQTFDNYDTNRDRNIDRNEFNERNNQNYQMWDTNRDNNLDEREYYDYTFRSLDRDGDRDLNQEEWESGRDNVYGDYLDSDDFNQYDRDRNQRMSQDEFDRSMRGTYFYGDMDTNRDRRVDTDEFNQRSFEGMDRNRDDRVDQSEYDGFNSFYTGSQIRSETGIQNGTRTGTPNRGQN